MNIQEAILKARKESGMICRPFGERGALLILRLPRSDNGIFECRVQYPNREATLFHMGWAPNLHDFLANNWVLLSPEET